MINEKYANDLKTMSANSYKDNPVKINGWKLVDKYYNAKNGFYCFCYYRNGEIVISYRGTDVERGKKESTKDAVSDIMMGGGLVPIQVKDAQAVYNKMKAKYPNAKISHTGHSLGGSIAQIMSALTGDLAVTFGAYGTGNILINKGIYEHRNLNIINFGEMEDPIFNHKLNRQPGRTYIIDTGMKENEPIYIKNMHEADVRGWDSHLIENMGNPMDSVEVFKVPNASSSKNNLLLKASAEKSDFVEPKRLTNAQRIEQRLRDEWASALEEKGADSSKVQGVFAKAADEEISGKKAAKRDFLREELESDALENERFVLSASSKRDEEKFEKVASLDDYVNEVIGNNKIFTREDIDYMSAADYQKNVKAIKYQREKIGIPTDKQADKAVKSGGMVYVHSYTRGDGVEVQAYYRARPSR